MSNEKDLMASAAQAAFANNLPSNPVDQDALLLSKVNANNTSSQTETTSTGSADTSSETKDTTSAQTATTTDTASSQTTTASKSFEEYLAEKSNGRVKSWDEVETFLNNDGNTSPKYNSEIAEKIDKFIASGGKIDENWIKTQTKDYSSIENPIDLFREKMRIENPELSDVEIEYELNERYKLDQWEDDDDSPLQQAMSAKIAREAKQALEYLVDNQKKLSVFTDGKTSEQIEQQHKLAAQAEEAANQARSKFSDDVRATVSEIEKLSFKPLEDFEIDYTLSKDEKESVANIVSSLYDGSIKLLEPYLQKSGDQITGIDLKGLATKLAKAEIFDSVLKKVAQESKAAGASNIVKNQKNINFSAESKSTSDAKPTDANSIIAAHFASKL